MQPENSNTELLLPFELLHITNVALHKTVFLLLTEDCMKYIHLLTMRTGKSEILVTIIIHWWKNATNEKGRVVVSEF
jgi:hypothetical protein